MSEETTVHGPEEDEVRREIVKPPLLSGEPGEPGEEDEYLQREHIPVMQQVLDNPFLLLFLGITVPTVFYIIWGVMEIITIPLAP
jgi:hypothetical protein